MRNAQTTEYEIAMRDRRNEKKPQDMDRDELQAEMDFWSARVKHASGWPSAFFAAGACQGVQDVARDKGWEIHNPHPVQTLYDRMESGEELS